MIQIGLALAALLVTPALAQLAPPPPPPMFAPPPPRYVIIVRPQLAPPELPRVHHHRAKPAKRAKIPLPPPAPRAALAMAPVEPPATPEPSFDERWMLNGQPILQVLASGRMAQAEAAQPIAPARAAAPAPATPPLIAAVTMLDDIALPAFAACFVMLVGSGIRRGVDRWLHPVNWSCPPILDLNRKEFAPC